MEKLCYSDKEKLVFWIAGYRGSSNKVDDIIASLQKDTAEFVALTEVARDAVRTQEVTESCRYKSMSVFYAKTDHAPEGAFHLGDDWTMSKWLKY